jgi:Tol biopolymer transport system component
MNLASESQRTRLADLLVVTCGFLFLLVLLLGQLFQGGAAETSSETPRQQAAFVGDWHDSRRYESISLDGRLIAYLSDDPCGDACFDESHLFIADKASDSVLLAVPLPCVDAVLPTWAPDNRHLALTFRTEETGAHADIYLLDSVTGELRNLTNSPDVSEANPMFSPDGSTLAFSASTGGRRDVFTIPVDGGRPRRVTSGRNTPTSRNFCPTWSADGSRIAYRSDTHAEWSIAADGSGSAIPLENAA